MSERHFLRINNESSRLWCTRSQLLIYYQYLKPALRREEGEGDGEEEKEKGKRETEGEKLHQNGGSRHRLESVCGWSVLLRDKAAPLERACPPVRTSQCVCQVGDLLLNFIQHSRVRGFPLGAVQSSAHMYLRENRVVKSPGYPIRKGSQASMLHNLHYFPLLCSKVAEWDKLVSLRSHGLMYLVSLPDHSSPQGTFKTPGVQV